MRLVQCPDVATYEQLARVAGLIPVLGARNEDDALAHALGAERIERPVAGGPEGEDALDGAARVTPMTPPATGEGPDCVVARADGYLPFAVALSRWTGRELVMSDDFQILPTLRARSALLIGEPDAFSFGCLARIASVALRADAAPALGIITARAAEVVSRRVARVAFSRPGSPRRSVSIDTLTAAAAGEPSLFEGPIDALVTATHSSSIDMDLHLGVLCGRSAGAAKATSYPCAFEKGCKRSPKGDRLLLRIDALDARVLFAESCNGIALRDGLYPRELSLALSAMEGPLAAYIATFKLVRSSQGLLHCLGGALLDAGYEFGAVTSIVNRAQAAIIKDAPSYVLIGDPCQRLPRPAGPRQLRVEGRVSELPLTLDVDCGGFHGRALEIAIPVSSEIAARLDDTRLHIAISPPPSPHESGFAVLLPWGDDEARLFLCMDEARPFERVQLASESGDATTYVRSVVEGAWRALATLSVIQAGVAAAPAATDASTQCVEELDDILERGHQLTATAEQLLQSSHPRVTRFDGPALPVDAVLKAYSDLSREVVSGYPRWNLSSHLAWAYHQRIAPEGYERPCGPCDMCGSPCFEIDYRSLRSDGMERIVTHCARCNILSDRPATHRRVELRGPKAVTAGGAAHFEWLLWNDRPFTIEVSVTALFPHTPTSFGCRFTPPECTMAIPSGGSVIVPAVLRVPHDTSPGQYSLVVLASELLALQVAARPLRIDPPTPTP